MRCLIHRFVCATRFSPRRVVIAVALIAGSGVLAATAAHADESAFVAQSNAAMTRMMTGMQIQPSGNTDEDFVAMMVPHHQGAIDMARAELQYGQNETLRRMAQEIIVTQQQEIVAMQQALGQPSTPTQTGSTPANMPPMADH
jgi:Domain of unknown function (DUF305)